jgi:hypothetical protein
MITSLLLLFLYWSYSFDTFFIQHKIADWMMTIPAGNEISAHL